jgi:hypothetical protein
VEEGAGFTTTISALHSPVASLRRRPSRASIAMGTLSLLRPTDPLSCSVFRSHQPCSFADCFPLRFFSCLGSRVQARLRSESTVSPRPTPSHLFVSRPAAWLGRLTLVVYARCAVPCLRFRKDRPPRRQGRPPVPRCRARRRQRPLHHHRLHGTCLHLHLCSSFFHHAYIDLLLCRV